MKHRMQEPFDEAMGRHIKRGGKHRKMRGPFLLPLLPIEVDLAETARLRALVPVANIPFHRR